MTNERVRALQNASATQILVHDRHTALVAQAEQHRLAGGGRRAGVRQRFGSLLVGVGLRLARPYEIRLASRGENRHSTDDLGLVLRVHT